MKNFLSQNASVIFDIRRTAVIGLIALTVVTSSMFTVCQADESSAPTPQTPEMDTRQNATVLLDVLFGSFREFKQPDFGSLVSDTFIPERQMFLSQLAMDAARERLIDVRYVIDTAVADGDTLAVTFRWEKKIVPYNATVEQIVKGTATCVFKQENSKWLLSAVNGDNPF